MPRFFTEEVSREQAHIGGEDARHMALSLRMKPGEHVTVCDMRGMDYECTIREISPQDIYLDVSSMAPSAGEPSVAITLYQALPKGDKLELIIQKAVELGVYRIVPVLTHRCVSRPDAKAMAKKLERYNRIALEAAKQSGRGRIPEVAPLMEFSAALNEMKGASLGIFFYENSQVSLKSAISNRLQNDVSIMVGSEGGFEQSEADTAEKQELLSLSLGNRILRCETAPLAALSTILYEAGDY